MLGAAWKKSPLLRLPLPPKCGSSLTIARASQSNLPVYWFHSPSGPCKTRAPVIKHRVPQGLNAVLVKRRDALLQILHASVLGVQVVQILRGKKEVSVYE